MNKIVDAVEAIYQGQADGDIVLPQRIFTKTRDGGDYLYGAVTNLKTGNYIVRSSAYMPWRAKEGKPIVEGAYMYTSFNTGELLAVVNGVDIVNYRTGAKSAVAAKYLAKKDSKVLGIIGFGQQAKTQAEAIATQFDLERIVIYSPNASKHIENIKYIKDKTGLGVEIVERDEVVKSADILVTATLGDDVMVQLDELQPGQLLISLAHREEVDHEIVSTHCTFVDTYESAKNETGTVKIALENGMKATNLAGELAEIVSGKKAGRESDDEIIYFQSLGVTHEDMAAVEYLYEELKDKVVEVEI